MLLCYSYALWSTILQRRTRNRVCIWLIFGGLLNWLIYTVIYADLGGDAKNGWVEIVQAADGQAEKKFFISGHFLHGAGGRSHLVAQWVWIYSYVHSITLWPSSGAMIICMLILARPHIIATMKESVLIRGPTFITVVITLTAALCSIFTVLFTIHFIRELCI